ncbi:MAG: GDSL-type esterase/lipase family protein [Saprospiraceae bacterium]
MISICVLLLALGCMENGSDPNEKTEITEIGTFSYIALGDSYTIGEGVPATESFPLLLEKKMLEEGFKSTKPTKIIAKTGWTCDALSKNIASQSIPDNAYNMVTLLIGVNDQYQNLPVENYPSKFTSLVNEAIRISGDKDRVIIVSIPDYSVTPFGKSRDAVKISQELAKYNETNKTIATQMGIKYVNITDISLKAAQDLTYLASDQLHPSAKMYGEWVDRIWSEARKILEK